MAGQGNEKRFGVSILSAGLVSARSICSQTKKQPPEGGRQRGRTLHKSVYQKRQSSHAKNLSDKLPTPKRGTFYDANMTRWIFLLLVLLSLYDWRTGRVPNWATLPLLVAGMIAHFPGDALLWFGSGLLFAAWRSSWMGAGDAKLWIALFWLVPAEGRFLPFFFVSLLLTALLQLAYRFLSHAPLSGARRPAAWRALPYLLLVHYVR